MTNKIDKYTILLSEHEMSVLKEALLQARIHHDGYVEQCLEGSEEFSKLLDRLPNSKWESHRKRWMNRTPIGYD
jgi:hypothetical protein